MSGQTLRAVADDLGVSVRVVTPPRPIVSLDRAKRHLNVEHDEHNGLIDGIVAAAHQHLDGPDGWLGRALGLQTLEVRADRLPASFLPLPYPPVREIVSVAYDDASGEQQIDASGYKLDPMGLIRATGATWPSVTPGAGVVRVTFTAGYDPGQVPAPIVQAILLTVGHLYANRSATGDPKLAELPMGVQYLLAPYRVWRAD